MYQEWKPPKSVKYVSKNQINFIHTFYRQQKRVWFDQSSNWIGPFLYESFIIKWQHYTFSKIKIFFISEIVFWKTFFGLRKSTLLCINIFTEQKDQFKLRKSIFKNFFRFCKSKKCVLLGYISRFEPHKYPKTIGTIWIDKRW